MRGERVLLATDPPEWAIRVGPRGGGIAVRRHGTRTVRVVSDSMIRATGDRFLLGVVTEAARLPEETVARILAIPPKRLRYLMESR